MNKILTVQEFLKEKSIDNTLVEELLIEFTKTHLQAQKEAIKKELEEGLETFGISLVDDFKLEQTGNCLIDNAYPLDNIK